MGQHCLVNPMACNLIFDDGTCMDQCIPGGLTDWINSLYTNAESLDYGFVWKNIGELIGNRRVMRRLNNDKNT